jgi:hypothetical protein
MPSHDRALVVASALAVIVRGACPAPLDADGLARAVRSAGRRRPRRSHSPRRSVERITHGAWLFARRWVAAPTVQERGSPLRQSRACSADPGVWLYPRATPERDTRTPSASAPSLRARRWRKGAARSHELTQTAGTLLLDRGRNPRRGSLAAPTSSTSGADFAQTAIRLDPSERSAPLRPSSGRFCGVVPRFTRRPFRAADFWENGYKATPEPYVFE